MEARVRSYREAGLPGRIERAVLDQPTRRVVTILAVGIGLMAILGSFQRLGWGFSLFDFDGEGKPPAAWSALVIGSAGGIGLLLGRADAAISKWWYTLGGFFLFMALDEGIELHERAQSLFHEDWQHLWAPIVLVGGIAWLVALRRMWPMTRERALLIGGAVCWFISQVDEHFQSNPQEGKVAGYGALSGIEEILEVTGSALFLLALLGVLRRLAESRA